MISNKENVVRKLANRIVDKYNLTPPIDFKCIFDGENIQYVEEDCRAFDGYSILENLKVVVNNQTTYLPRKRFTIAHEIGHCIIPWHDDVTICQTDEYYTAQNMLDIQEKEANVFAAELLMPLNWIAQILENYLSLGLNYVIDYITREANTSVMACVYALESALPSGHVLFVKNAIMQYEKKFISKNTCGVWFRTLDLHDVCDYFCISKEEVNCYSYTIQHYSFKSCPSKDEVSLCYCRNKKDIIKTLNDLSDGNICLLFHCLDSILEYIDDRFYMIIYYDESIVSTIVSSGCLVEIPYAIKFSELLKFYSKYTHKGIIVIDEHWRFIWILEEKFVEDSDWLHSEIDSRKLLKIILRELYDEKDIESRSYSINGLIGITNGSNLGVPRERLYNALRHKFLRNGYENFIAHPQYETFISLRIDEIRSREPKKKKR